MRKLAIVAGAATVFMIGCTKNDLVAESKLSTNSASLSQTALNGISANAKNYIVLCKQQGVSKELLEKLSHKGTVSSALEELGLVMVSSANPSFKQELETMPEVQSVVPDLKINWQKATYNAANVIAADETALPSESSVETNTSLGLSGTNPLVPLQWSLSSVAAKGAYQAGFKGKGATVAVLDGGFHLQHPDLVGNIISAVSFVPGQPAQMSNLNTFSHGSHVAGIIAAGDNNIGVAGIAPEAKLMLVKVLGDNGSGAFSWIIQGVYHAASQGADIINMSLGAAIPRNGRFVDDGGTPDDTSDDVIVNEAKEVQELITAMNRAFQYARKKGSLAIVAAGNDATYVTGQGQGTFYPANCTGVVAIAANAPQNWALNTSTSLFVPSSFTNFGSSLIQFGAPGGDFDGSGEPGTVAGYRYPAYILDMVLSAGNSRSYSWAAGTSMACPAASAVAALIVGKYGGDISPAQIISKMKASAVDMGAPGKDDYFGLGQVNAARAVQQ